jgi:hypothetical protein
MEIKVKWAKLGFSTSYHPQTRGQSERTNWMRPPKKQEKWYHQMEIKVKWPKIGFCTAYHPQMGGQSKRPNQMLEDMLSAYALDFGGSWEDINLWQNSHTTKAIRLVYRWHHLKHSMEGSVHHLSIGTNLEPVKSIILTMSKRSNM